MKRLALVIILFLIACGQCFGWTGKVVGVTDGDTIVVMHQGKPEKIRLFGIDCPERDQDFGRQARKFTARMAFGNMADVNVVTTDRYGRTVAWVSVKGLSLNKELVRAGLAWWYKRYAGREHELEFLENEARGQKIGLWSARNPVPPWEFRRSNKEPHKWFRLSPPHHKWSPW